MINIPHPRDMCPRDHRKAQDAAKSKVTSSPSAFERRDNQDGFGLHKLFACEIDDSTWDFISRVDPQDNHKASSLYQGPSSTRGF
jgi:hypothetical protein